MSIAVSVAVHPSRLLRYLIFSAAAAGLSIGLAVIVGWLGDLALAQRALVGVLSVFMAFFGFYHGARHRKTLHIDISGEGQIRISKMMHNCPCSKEGEAPITSGWSVVEMMDNSTIWPNLLVLRLRAKDGVVTVVPILQDSVSENAFRALTVACRWIAARGRRRIEKFDERSN